MIGQSRGAPYRELPLGPGGPAALLPWTFAFLVYVAGLAGAGWLTLEQSLRTSDAALGARWTVQVPADASNARLDTVVALLRQTRGIAAVDLLDPAATARLLEPWLGPAAPLDELPLPRLIDVQIAPGDAPDVAGLRQKLASIVPEARLDDQLPWPVGMRAAARRIEAILVAAVTLAPVLGAAAAVCAAQGVALVGRSPAALLHVLGAEDAFIARRVAVHAARLTLIGGVIGAIAALLTILAVGEAGAIVQFPAPLAATGIADWRVWAMLTATVGVAGLLALAATEIAMRRRLARTQ